MRCDEIREKFIDLLYDERREVCADPELQAHVKSCAVCRRELEELGGVRAVLSLWAEEPPLRPVDLKTTRKAAWWRRPAWLVARRVAVAAVVLLAFLAVTNAEITWEKGRFSFRTSFLPPSAFSSSYYTKSEIRDLVGRALDDTESRMTETNYLMMQRMMDTIDQERWSEMRFVKSQGNDIHVKN